MGMNREEDREVAIRTAAVAGLALVLIVAVLVCEGPQAPERPPPSPRETTALPWPYPRPDLGGEKEQEVEQKESKPPQESEQLVWIDGRDPSASPPGTIRWINLWEGPGPRRGRVVGRLHHGTRAAAHRAKYIQSEDRHYYDVEADGERGWVPESFVSHDPVSTND